MLRCLLNKKTFYPPVYMFTGNEVIEFVEDVVKIGWEIGTNGLAGTQKIVGIAGRQGVKAALKALFTPPEDTQISPTLSADDLETKEAHQKMDAMYRIALLQSCAEIAMYSVLITGSASPLFTSGTPMYMSLGGGLVGAGLLQHWNARLCDRLKKAERAAIEWCMTVEMEGDTCRRAEKIVERFEALVADPKPKRILSKMRFIKKRADALLKKHFLEQELLANALLSVEGARVKKAKSVNDLWEEKKAEAERARAAGKTEPLIAMTQNTPEIDEIIIEDLPVPEVIGEAVKEGMETIAGEGSPIAEVAGEAARIFTEEMLAVAEDEIIPHNLKLQPLKNDEEFPRPPVQKKHAMIPFSRTDQDVLEVQLTVEDDRVVTIATTKISLLSHYEPEPETYESRPPQWELAEDWSEAFASPLPAHASAVPERMRSSTFCKQLLIPRSIRGSRPRAHMRQPGNLSPAEGESTKREQYARDQKSRVHYSPAYRRS